MAEILDNSTDKADVSDDTNDKSVDAGIGDKEKDSNQNNKVEEKKYSDKDYNDFVKRKTAELSSKAEEKHKKSLEGKLILTQEELDAKTAEIAKNAVEAYKKESALAAKRESYKAKGLTDAQLDAISVDKVEDYDKRVTELFGALLKKEPPVLHSNNNASGNADDEVAKAMKELIEKKRR